MGLQTGPYFYTEYGMIITDVYCMSERRIWGNIQLETGSIGLTVEGDYTEVEK